MSRDRQEKCRGYSSDKDKMLCIAADMLARKVIAEETKTPENELSFYKAQGGKLYLDCYSAFGGINGSWGAKNEYTIQLDDDTEMIAIYRSPNCYDPVLKKGEDGVWVFSKLIYGEPQEPADDDIIHGEGETLAIEGISQKEVEDIGLEQCKVNYDYTSVGFNHEEHRWIVEFWEYAGKVPTQTVLIDTEGNVLGIRYAE